MGKQQVNEFDINGKVLHVGMPVYFTEKMSKRVCVLEAFADGKFRQEVAFDFVNDNMNLLDKIREGDWVNIAFQLRGNKKIQADGKARWFNAIEGLSCTKQ